MAILISVLIVFGISAIIYYYREALVSILEVILDFVLDFFELIVELMETLLCVFTDPAD